MVNVTGGEPLLRKDLFDVMERVHGLGFPWGMVTNGSLITEETIQRMKNAGMGTVSVSIDGLFEDHENLRRLPGAFPHIMDMIIKMDRERFLDTIQITTVVTRKNIDSLETMLEYFQQFPVDSWRLAIVDPIGRCRDQKDLLLQPIDLEKYFSFLACHAFNEKPVLTTSCSHYLGNKDTLYRGHSFQCRAGKSVASILADGSIFVCPNVPRRSELIQGNILQDDFVQVWEERFDWFRKKENRKTGQCRKCSEWETCRGDSLHTWNFEKRKPEFCYKSFDKQLLIKHTPNPVMLFRMKEQLQSLKGIRFSYRSSSEKTIYFGPESAEQLYHYFHWGKNHPSNICEQMMGAAGYVLENQIWVEELIPVPLLSRGKKTAKFHIDLHKYVQQEIHLINRNLKTCPNFFQEPMKLVGYIHSHPGELNAVMSQPDLKLHTILTSNETTPLFTGIINPQRKDLCIYWDSIYFSNQVILFAEEGDIKKWF